MKLKALILIFGLAVLFSEILFAQTGTGMNWGYRKPGQHLRQGGVGRYAYPHGKNYVAV